MAGDGRVFRHRGGELHAEGLGVEALARSVGTPFYLYSHAALEAAYRGLRAAFTAADPLVCYSVKASPNLAILRTFAQLGSGFDVVSGGELLRVLHAGASPGRVVFSGAGKTAEEIAYALAHAILLVNVESAAELELVDELGGRAGRKASVSVRVNPDVDPRTHPYITTGRSRNKFGVDLDEALDLYERARGLANVEALGVACHIGSNIRAVEPFVQAMERLRTFLEGLARRGHPLRYCDVGGGFAIRYGPERVPALEDYARAILDTLRPETFPVKLILEPGRALVGAAGMLVCRVLYVKAHRGKTFVIVDAGMNDFMRPCLYDAHHEIVPVTPRGRPRIRADVVGPLCEQTDFLALDREIEAVAPGELLAVRDAGAYGFALSSSYNSRPRPAEVLVRGGDFHLIRRRESPEDLLGKEDMPAFLEP